MSIEMDDECVKNATDDDIIEWLLFEVGERKNRRRLPNPLDRFDLDFTHRPVFDRIISIKREKQ